MQTKFSLALLVLGMLLLAACVPMPVKDYNNIIVERFDGKPVTMDDMEHVIRAAAFKEEWHVQSQIPGHIVLTKRDDDGSWTITVEVVYSTQNYSIHYVSSQGLQYDPATHKIKRRYNSAVDDLTDQINDTLQDITPGS
jgi:hypothetical protein